MTLAQLLANSMPFLMSYLIQALRAHMPSLAEGTLKISLADTDQLQGFPRVAAVQLAVQFYRQVSFLLTLMLSTLSALVFTLNSGQPALGFVAGSVLIGEVFVWFFRWQSLSTGSEPGVRSRRDKEMNHASFWTTTLMLGITVLVQWK